MDNDEVSDQRTEHRTDQEVSVEMLNALGVLSWSGLKGAEDPRLHKIQSDRGYSYTDVVNVRKETLPDFENKIKNFFREHIHYDEEIRYCLDGSGYFDVRDKENRWIRVSLHEGDLIVLPEGIYHRFTCDSDNYIQAMRLFVGEPIWTPYNRDEIDDKKNESRQKYVKVFY